MSPRDDGAAVRDLLASRARSLAQPLPGATAGEALQLIIFSLGGERYGIELAGVVEVFRITTLSRVPGAGATVFGITAWRGELLTVLDLRRVLGLPASALDDLRVALVLGDRRAPVAVLADAVDGLRTVGPQALSPVPEGLPVRADVVRGITPDAVVLLDHRRLLDTQAVS